jgi:hypothetical protein
LVRQGLKIEWATVKDSHLYVGSTGKEWTTGKGVTSTHPDVISVEISVRPAHQTSAFVVPLLVQEFVNNNPQWIARIDSEGRIERLDWSQHYTALRSVQMMKEKGVPHQVTHTSFSNIICHLALSGRRRTRCSLAICCTRASDGTPPSGGGSSFRAESPRYRLPTTADHSLETQR